ncbi:MAG: Mu-like prophage major head subunit gpT family protein [Chloroflexi bacterium]|nr:Mu-like prophage major head subunit gpT family protein [Chloroflexota bacterium]
MFTIANAAGLDAARVGFHAAFLEQLGIVAKNPLEALFREVPSTTGLEEWEWLGDLPDFEEWKGDRFLAGLEAFKLRVLNKDWASGIRVHQNDIKDDRLGLVAPKIEGLAQRARSHRVRLMMRLLVNGFTGLEFPAVGNGLGYDGAFFFSAAHATGSNKLTAALTKASLETAELLLQSQTSYDGVDTLEIMGTDLIIGPKLVPVANALMKSDFFASVAGTASETNYLKGRYNIHVSPLLRGTYNNYWFLADMSKGTKPFLFQNREEISTSAVIGGQGTQSDSVPRFQRGELWFGAEARYNVAYWEHRLIVGSNQP